MSQKCIIWVRAFMFKREGKHDKIKRIITLIKRGFKILLILLVMGTLIIYRYSHSGGSTVNAFNCGFLIGFASPTNPSLLAVVLRSIVFIFICNFSIVLSMSICYPLRKSHRFCPNRLLFLSLSKRKLLLCVCCQPL